MPSAQLGREQTCCFIVISQSQISIGSHSVTASSNAATKSFETRGSNMQCSSITRCQDSSHGSSCLTQFCRTDSECLFLFLWKFSQLQKGMTNATTRFNFDKEHNERHMRWPATATGAPVSACKKKTQAKYNYTTTCILHYESQGAFQNTLPLDVCFSSPAALYNPEYTSLNHHPCLRSRT